MKPILFYDANGCPWEYIDEDARVVTSGTKEDPDSGYHATHLEHALQVLKDFGYMDKCYPTPTFPSSNMRITKDEMFMSIAQAVAQRSTCRHKHAVGAVLVSPEYHILATGYNGAPSGMQHCDDPTPGANCITDETGRCIRALHAEENVLIQCAKYGTPCTNSTLYITLAPCVRCARMLYQAGIKVVIYKGAPPSSSNMDLLKGKIIFYQYESL